MVSENSDAISGPLKTSLSNPKRIFSGSNAPEVNIDPQTHNVIMQLRHPRRAQRLVARVSEQADIVASFLAPNRKIKNQVLSGSRNFQNCLTGLRLALPASHRPLTKIQDGRVSCFDGVLGSHPQPSPHGEEQSSSTGRRPSQDASALDHRLPTKLLKFLEARTA